MDGLDEWNPTEEAKKRLTHKGMPNIEGVSSCVSCFISMRPWMFPKISKLVQVDDKVIEIHGLSEAGMENVIQNVLLNHYKLEEKSSKYEETYNTIIKNMKDESLKSFMQIPLLAVVCVQIWYEGKQVRDSLTSFYIGMVDMLFERAYQKLELEIECEMSNQVPLPEALSDYDNMQNYGSLLLRLGKVAYEGLLSHEDSLIFQKRKLEKEIGARELQLALDVGLISQRDAPSTLAMNVSVNFFHKSVQEFLAAIHVVSKKEVGDSFCKLLSKFKSIMRLSNVIMFICGMCPTLGSAISQYVVNASDNDKEVSMYRESGLVSSRVKELYKLQTTWYKELQYGQTDSQVKFFFSDVYLWYDENDIETVRTTRSILSDNHCGIRSIWLYLVPTDENKGISNAILNEFLGNSEKTKSLIMLYIYGQKNNRVLDTNCGSSIRNLYLEHVALQKRNHEGNILPPLITHMPQLRMVGLEDLDMGDRRFGVSVDMTDLKTVKLETVKMSSDGWNSFVTTISGLPHNLNVQLDYTDIDEESLNVIKTSPNYKVTRDGVNKYGRYLHFDKEGQENQNMQ